MRNTNYIVRLKGNCVVLGPSSTRKAQSVGGTEVRHDSDYYFQGEEVDVIKVESDQEGYVVREDDVEAIVTPSGREYAAAEVGNLDSGRYTGSQDSHRLVERDIAHVEFISTYDPELNDFVHERTEVDESLSSHDSTLKCTCGKEFETMGEAREHMEEVMTDP